MFNFNRLFWKVFLSIWLSSFAVMMVTVLVIGELAEEDNFKARIRLQVQLQAERFLARYESNKKFRAKIIAQNKRPKPHQDSHWYTKRKGLPPIAIYDDQNQLIIGGKKRPKGEMRTLELTAESGRKYKVWYFLQTPRNSLARWQGLITSIQAVLILLSSTFASFIVVRPMNKLRHHLQRLKSGEFSVRVEDKLHQRGDEIGDFAREFNQMAEYVENTLIGQQRLFQNVSHELRAPLARLLAASGIVEQQIDQEHPAVTRIQLECERLSLLIDELLALARLQQEMPANRPFDVESI
jgi:methyl-accepting chemotaxis protein